MANASFPGASSRDRDWPFGRNAPAQVTGQQKSGLARSRKPSRKGAEIPAPTLWHQRSVASFLSATGRKLDFQGDRIREGFISRHGFLGRNLALTAPPLRLAFPPRGRHPPARCPETPWAPPPPGGDLLSILQGLPPVLPCRYFDARPWTARVTPAGDTLSHIMLASVVRRSEADAGHAHSSHHRSGLGADG